MRKIFSIFIGLFCVGFAAISHAEISSVAYIHKTILSEKGITLPIESGADASGIAGFNYVMRQIDRANEIWGNPTNYANSEAQNIVAVANVLKNIQDLIQKGLSEFSVQLTGMTAGAAFSFQMSAVGEFNVDWGDGNIETIARTNTTNTTYTHTYSAAGDYTIGIGGDATEYSTSDSVAAISFAGSTNKTKITGISGSLGAIFPTIGTGVSNGQQPRFYNTFSNCTGLSGSIPTDLFSGISGPPATHMFAYTFSNCTGLSGSIPSGLFSTISGAPAASMFTFTFSGCTGLSGGIPAGLFSTISGAPADGMFYGTFYNCTRLTGAIPASLFSGIKGAPAGHMFYSTFEGCSGLTTIPTGLFSGINGAPASGMFYLTFYGCTGLTGSIPAGLFGTFTGPPASHMFDGTFEDCNRLTGIGSGIWNLSGVTNASAASMFYRTFYNASNITSASPSIAPGSSTKLWTKFSSYTGQRAFNGATRMSDYSSIPTAWK